MRRSAPQPLACPAFDLLLSLAPAKPGGRRIQSVRCPNLNSSVSLQQTSLLHCHSWLCRLCHTTPCCPGLPPLMGGQAIAADARGGAELPVDAVRAQRICMGRRCRRLHCSDLQLLRVPATSRRCRPPLPQPGRDTDLRCDLLNPVPEWLRTHQNFKIMTDRTVFLSPGQRKADFIGSQRVGLWDHFLAPIPAGCAKWADQHLHFIDLYTSTASVLPSTSAGEQHGLSGAPGLRLQ